MAERPVSRPRPHWPGRLPIAVAIVSLVATSCAGADPSTSTPSSSLPTSSPGQGGEAGEVVLLAGSIVIPGASSFEEPGFHEAYFLTGMVPEPAAEMTGELVVRLRDAGRPNQTCARDHPLSGCVTVDWSDFEGRPGVPVGGVFDNRVAVMSTAGATTLFLSETRGLAQEPDEYSPT